MNKDNWDLPGIIWQIKGPWVLMGAVDQVQAWESNGKEWSIYLAPEQEELILVCTAILLLVQLRRDLQSTPHNSVPAQQGGSHLDQQHHPPLPAFFSAELYTFSSDRQSIK